MEAYETLSEAITALKLQGYTADFNLKENCLECIAYRVDTSLAVFLQKNTNYVILIVH